MATLVSVNLPAPSHLAMLLITLTVMTLILEQLMLNLPTQVLPPAPVLTEVMAVLTIIAAPPKPSAALSMTELVNNQAPFLKLDVLELRVINTVEQLPLPTTITLKLLTAESPVASVFKLLRKKPIAPTISPGAGLIHQAAIATQFHLVLKPVNKL